ncbi:hypothetical protein BC831DRAFT_321 [Entophlyctis helioformis]|nr:hypothetical protein BC831DRAFT_321 [Entophlyctis helioformis]
MDVAAIPAASAAVAHSTADSAVVHADPVELAAAREAALVEPTSLQLFSFSHAGLQAERDLALVSMLSLSDDDIVIHESSPVVASLSDDRRALPASTLQHHSTAAPSFKPYSSALGQFQSFRLISAQGSVKEQQESANLHSLTWSTKIDPSKALCQYEADSGQCSDSTCTAQHFRDFEMTDDEVLADLMQTSASLLDELQLKALSEDLRSKRLAGASSRRLADVVRDIIGRQDPVTLDRNVFRAAHLHARSVQKTQLADASRRQDIPPLSTKTPFRMPPAVPILCSGVAELMAGVIDRPSRYYESLLSRDEHEAILCREPTNVAAWVNYAVSEIEPVAGNASGGDRVPNFNSALKILNRALELNHASEHLWCLYIDLYQRVGKNARVESLFAQAVALLPESFAIWWQWALYQRANGSEAQLTVLERMLNHCCSSSSSSQQQQQHSDSGSVELHCADCPDIYRSVSYQRRHLVPDLGFEWAATQHGRHFAAVRYATPSC